MKKFQSINGFSLVEMAIGLAVMTILILAITMSSGIRDNARSQSAANSIQTLRSAAENYLASGKVNFAGMTVDRLKAVNLLPGNFNAGNSNPWGGDYILQANAGNNTQFDVGVTGLTKIDADKLSSYFNNTASAVVFDEGKNTWTATF